MATLSTSNTSSLQPQFRHVDLVLPTIADHRLIRLPDDNIQETDFVFLEPFLDQGIHTWNAVQVLPSMSHTPLIRHGFLFTDSAFVALKTHVSLHLNEIANAARTGAQSPADLYPTPRGPKSTPKSV